MPSSNRPPKSTKVFRRSRRDLWLLRTVALVISILLWITVFGGKKGEIAKHVLLDYQIPKGLVIANQVPHEVIFRVAGPRAFLREYQDRPLSIPIDLSNFKIGDYQVSLGEELLDIPLGLRVVSLSQTSLSVKLDRSASKRLSVRPVFGDSLPKGSKVRAVLLTPDAVDVHGAESALQNLTSIPTDPIPVSPDKLQQEFDVSIALTDLPGLFVDEPNKTVHVSLDLQDTGHAAGRSKHDEE